MASELKFKSLEIRNFLSIGNQTQTLELDGGDSILIEGRNMDIPGVKNGVGKTTLINAICYALYNKPFDNISLQRLINSTNATKNTLMEVRLTFDKDGNEYEIYRARGNDYRIEVKRNGEDITPGKGVYETDEIIVGIIGISYDMFTKTVIFSGASKPFLELPIAQQRTQIEELFNISILSEKAALLKEQIRTVEQDIKVAEAVLQQQQGAVTQYNKQLAEAEQRAERWEVQRDRQVAEIEATLSELDTVDIDREQKLHEERSTIKTKLIPLAAAIAASKKEKKDLEKQIDKLSGEYEHLSDAKCPYCKQSFEDAASKLEQIEADILRLTTLLEAVEASLLEDSEAEKTLKKDLASVEKSITHNDIAELIEARTNKTVLKQRKDDLVSAENPHIEPLEKLIEAGEPAVDTERVDGLKRMVDHQSFLLKLLTDKNSFLRRRIINQTIPVLNARLNHYTTDLGLPHMVKFDADMSCTVTEFGRELDFGNLSAGEKKRVNTSMALAFRDVLHQLHSKINLLMVDEIDGALDAIGLEAVVRCLKNKARDEAITTFVISHHPAAQGRFDRTLIVQKEQGFSSIFFE